MRQNSDYIVDNDGMQGLPRILGTLIRRLPLSGLLSILPPGEPMMKVESGRNEAYLPLSLVKRIVREAPPHAFAHSTDKVRMDGGCFFDLLQAIEHERMPLRRRYAVIDALCVGWAATMFTFVGDVTLEADQDTVDLALARGNQTGFSRASRNLEIARMAAAYSGRSLSSAPDLWAACG